MLLSLSIHLAQPYTSSIYGLGFESRGRPVGSALGNAILGLGFPPIYLHLINMTSILKILKFWKSYFTCYNTSFLFFYQTMMEEDIAFPRAVL